MCALGGSHFLQANHMNFLRNEVCYSQPSLILQSTTWAVWAVMRTP